MDYCHNMHTVFSHQCFKNSFNGNGSIQCLMKYLLVLLRFVSVIFKYLSVRFKTTSIIMTPMNPVYFLCSSKM